MSIGILLDRQFGAEIIVPIDEYTTPRASLRTGHNVAPGVNNGHRPLLNWRRHRVMGEFDVFGDDWPESAREEIVDRCRDILATC